MFTMLEANPSKSWSKQEPLQIKKKPQLTETNKKK